MPDTSLALQTLPDVGLLPKFKMATAKPEVEIIFNGDRWRRDSNFNPIFSTIPNMDMTLSTLSDVGRLPKFKMAAVETGSGGRHLEFR